MGSRAPGHDAAGHDAAVQAVVVELTDMVRTGKIDAQSSAALARHAVRVAKRVRTHPEDIGAVANDALSALVDAGVVEGSAAGVLAVLIDEGVVQELVHELHAVCLPWARTACLPWLRGLCARGRA